MTLSFDRGNKTIENYFRGAKTFLAESVLKQRHFHEYWKENLLPPVKKIY